MKHAYVWEHSDCCRAWTQLVAGQFLGVVGVHRKSFLFRIRDTKRSADLREQQLLLHLLVTIVPNYVPAVLLL